MNSKQAVTPPHLCLAWDHRDPGAMESADSLITRIETQPARWAIRLQKPGVRLYVPEVLVDSPNLLQLRNGAGIILGTIFPSWRQPNTSAASATRSLTSYEEERILQSEGRSLISSHWGSYILFLSNAETGDVHVVRGPMSAIPCFWVEFAGVTLFLSRPPDVFDLRLISPRVNWDLIRAQAAMGDYLCHETGLSGVFSLVSGDCVTLRRGKPTRRAYWTPKSSVDLDSSLRFETAAHRLHQTTRSVIDCWASLHPSLMVTLSGGLDSSIVLSCVARASSRPTVRAINFHSRLSGDERFYARSMATLCGVPLLEVALPGDVDFSCFLNCARTASPVLSFGAFATEPIFSRLCQQFNASAVFTGELGDGVFGHAYGPELLAETLWRYGPTPRTFRTMHGYATLHKLSVWRAARLALAEYRRYRHADCPGTYQRIRARSMPEHHGLAADETIETYGRMQARFIHPWLREATTGPPACLQTILGMIMLTSTWSHSAFSALDEAVLVSPLASQPIVETSLGIPADFHIADSISAAVARRAFGPLLSPEVIRRGKAKGNPEPWLKGLIARNRAFLRDFLLDGILVRERILDKRRTELALSTELTGSNVRVVDIIVQLHIEAWLRRWIGHAAVA